MQHVVESFCTSKFYFHCKFQDRILKYNLFSAISHATIMLAVYDMLLASGRQHEFHH